MPRSTFQKSSPPRTKPYLEMRALRAFVALANELHFGRAADSVGTSQPTLTQTIKYLEMQVGYSLFTRTKRSVVISDRGLKLLDDARSIVTRADNFLQAALAPDNLPGASLLHIGFQPAGMVSTPGHAFYRRLIKQCPHIRPILHEMTTAAQVRALQNRTLDIGIIFQPAGANGLKLHRLLHENCVIALASDHPLARQNEIALKDLRDLPLVLPVRETAPGLFDRIIAACVDAGFSPCLSHEATTFWSAASLTWAGAGVSIIPASLTRNNIQGVTFRKIRGTAPLLEMFAVWNPDNGSAIRQEALTHLEPAV